MRRKWWIWIGLGVTLFAAGFTVAQARMSSQKLQQKTLDNLHTAMQGEAFAYAKYKLFAEHARKNGHPEIAKLFDDAAQVELHEHFAEEAELAGLVGTDEENLRNAIEGETYESTTMYKQFAEEAASVEDHPAAERFEEIRQDETRHRAMFEKALQELTQPAEEQK
jgi:rubrerythrin